MFAIIIKDWCGYLLKIYCVPHHYCYWCQWLADYIISTDHVWWNRLSESAQPIKILGDSGYGFKYSIRAKKLHTFQLPLIHLITKRTTCLMLILNTCYNLTMLLCLQSLLFNSYVLLLERLSNYSEVTFLNVLKFKEFNNYL